MENYQIETKIGGGGMGDVYRAHHKILNRPVAIKYVKEAFNEDPDFLERFLREARLCAQLESEYIVRIYDSGISEGHPYIVMELLDGDDVRQRLNQVQQSGQRGLPVEEVVRIIRAVLSALEEAHAKNIIHRDIKAANVFLCRNGKIKVMDFGIAKALNESDMTQAGHMIGTPGFMSPEQAQGERVDGRSDLYSVGVLLHVLLTGERPTADKTQLLFDMPDWLREVIKKSLQHDPKARFQSAAEMRAALEQGAAVSLQPRPLEPTPGGTVSAVKASAHTVPAAANASDSAPTPAVSQISAADSARSGADVTPRLAIEFAHILFMDIVRYTQQSMNRMASQTATLRQIVEAAPEYQSASARKELICLDTGDGMALVFFRDPASPLQAALEIARALRSYPDISLRMGIHAGPVMRRDDLSGKQNVTGDGINFAQRVMNCGESGHILLSRNSAEALRGIEEWTSHLHDLGEFTVKHGERLYLFSYSDSNLGNPTPPDSQRLSAPDPGETEREARLKRGYPLITPEGPGSSAQRQNSVSAVTGTSASSLPGLASRSDQPPTASQVYGSDSSRSSTGAPIQHAKKPGFAVVGSLLALAVLAGGGFFWYKNSAPAEKPGKPGVKSNPPAVDVTPPPFLPSDRTTHSIKDGAVMLHIPAGEFLMGDASTKMSPLRRVNLPAYWIYRDLVTVAQYRAFCQASKGTMAECKMPELPSTIKGNYPIVNVTWKQAKMYAEWVGGDLPSEAQWEKAARSTDGRQYPWGNDWDSSKLQCSKQKGGDANGPAPVGSHPQGASRYGLTDMAGNVWQWCEDPYSDADKGMGDQTDRILRGGGWDSNDPGDFRTFFRSRNEEARKEINIGFRVVVAEK